MTRRSLIGVSLAAMLALGLAGCSSPSPTAGTPPPASSPSAASTTAQAGGTLDFATVERLTAPRFQTDPNCRAGEWSENSTGIDEEFRPAATTIQQYDCYESADQVGKSLPKRGQQSIYVEFNDAMRARSYAEDESVLYKVLVDQNRVVVAGTGLETVDMQAYLEEIKAACSCGEIIAQGT